MVKSYLRYEGTRQFGVIATQGSPIELDKSGQLAYCASIDGSVKGWHRKLGTVVALYTPENTSYTTASGVHQLEVTCIEVCADDKLAVGYNDGSICVFQLSPQSSHLDSGAKREPPITETLFVFRGHQNAISCLVFSADGSFLASGARNGDIVVWDVLQEKGVVRLKGHTDCITALVFIENSGQDAGKFGEACRDACQMTLVSGSRDALIKVWDVASQFCCQTLVSHRSEVGALLYESARGLLLSGGGDAVIRLHRLEKRVFSEIGGIDRVPFCTEKIVQLRWSKSGGYFVVVSAGRQVALGKVYNEEEMRKVRSRRRQRQKGKTQAEEEQDEKEGKQETDGLQGRGNNPADNLSGTLGQKEDHTVESVDALVDTVRLLRGFRVGHKLQRGVAVGASSKDGVPVIYAAENNVHTIVLPLNKTSPNTDGGRLEGIESVMSREGHREAIKAACLSPDQRILVTVSRDAIKFWRIEGNSCLRTILCSDILQASADATVTHFSAASVICGPQGLVLVGAREGHLALIDSESGDIFQVLGCAHAATMWALASLSSSLFVTGGSDKMLHFWELDLHDYLQKSSKNILSKKSNQLSTGASNHSNQVASCMIEEKAESSKDFVNPGLRLSRSLRMPDDVLAVAVSPDASLIAVALLDSTVRLFYADTLAFRASLYGHALPVSALSFSSDGALIATGSADKTIKVWGVDFGDCHGTLRVHKEPISAVTFVPNTHHLFSAGKDGLLWFHDADNRTSVTSLRGHSGPISAIVISEHGSLLISVGADRAIRAWERTESPIFLEVEMERKMEEQLDMQLADSFTASHASKSATEGAWPVAGTAPPSLSSLRHYERLLEVLELVGEDDAGRLEYQTALARQEGQTGLLGAPPPRPPLLTAFFNMYNNSNKKVMASLAVTEPILANAFLILQVIRSIPTPDLQEAILLLPLHAAVLLLRHIQTWLTKQWMPFTCTSLLCLILKVHGPYLHQSSDIKSLLSAISALGHPLLAHQRDRIGTNMVRAKLLLAEKAILI